MVWGLVVVVAVAVRVVVRVVVVRLVMVKEGGVGLQSTYFPMYRVLQTHCLLRLKSF